MRFCGSRITCGIGRRIEGLGAGGLGAGGLGAGGLGAGGLGAGGLGAGGLGAGGGGAWHLSGMRCETGAVVGCEVVFFCLVVRVKWRRF
jgi:hypothetical protein